ncbi:MAG TPA: ABC transporter permease subunit [Gemmataceae bacterium]|nr:ABC transporter permease subunit [Gemmataceae bacterium]
MSGSDGQEITADKAHPVIPSSRHPVIPSSSAGLLHYRPWRGEFRPPFVSAWPIARIALRMMFRRKLYWAMYALGLMMFLLFFFGQYLLAWAETQGGETSVPVMGLREDPKKIVHILRTILKLNGTGETYGNFFWYQGYLVMVVLALAGSLLVGNDIHYGSLPFYLSKPLSSWHYLLGKALAVGVFINLMTTLPAVVLWVQYGLLDSWDYFLDNWHLLAGILGYGLVLTVCLSLLLVATASWLRRTVPMIMAWTTLFLFCRLLAGALVDRLHFDPRWRLLDLWNDTYLVGNILLSIAPDEIRPAPQPDWYLGALVLGGVCILCLSYLILRIRAVEIVR